MVTLVPLEEVGIRGGGGGGWKFGKGVDGVGKTVILSSSSTIVESSFLISTLAFISGWLWVVC